jgi:hypothetical protein
MLVVVVSGLLSGWIAQMRSKTTLPLFPGDLGSVRLFLRNFMFFFTCATIKGFK